MIVGEMDRLPDAVSFTSRQQDLLYMILFHGGHDETTSAHLKSIIYLLVWFSGVPYQESKLS